MVRQQADALMLCGETAAGAFPDKCVGVLRAVATSIEEWCRCARARLLAAPGACRLTRADAWFLVQCVSALCAVDVSNEEWRRCTRARVAS